MTKQVENILKHYDASQPKILSNLERILNHGALKGTGKMVILPVDQGFEHGPAASFAPNPPAYDPIYHFELAIESGCNAYAAPFGFLEAGAKEFSKKIPLILKVNNSDSLYKDTENPIPAITSGVEEALQLGCAAIGLTIYPGSGARKSMYEDVKKIGLEARKAGLPLVIWSYPRGSDISTRGETSIDVVAYAAQIACQLGAHIVKVKPPSYFVEKQELVYKQNKIPIETLPQRVRHVLKSAFNGKRIVIFSGGQAQASANLLEEIRDLAQGGAFGSIVGRNAFQREKKEALHLLKQIIEIYYNSSVK